MIAPLQTIAPDHPAYPTALKTCGAFRTAPILNTIGNLEFLTQNTIALFCSQQCPGDLILKTYDLAQSLRDAEIPIISGFHTPIEQDCLKIMLRSTQPIIHCPARSISTIRLSPEQKQAMVENRLLLVSPFSSSYPRVTVELAGKRNDMIGAIAHTIFIAYAAPNSKTLAFAQSLISAGKSVVTFASSSNPLLQEQGIVGLEIETIVRRCLDAQTSHTQKATSIDNER
ncbi:DNA-processing protein DprA [Leptothermofonsia sichuanensis E412]|uniref:DNA-processing protein DprA n=1 Tax=Leptothermofonsia sichuanensis TaxID=2917832 RepID=UPI001CA71225|nr:DNA-processing protein DprA [Leptothermofonsia sichuanensis]QZZ19830.1 DNA-processing protein DprA [Leptothermofonsia sichuanensis E412]